MTILPKHAAILSSLSKGTITVNSEDGENTDFVIDSGFIENKYDSLTIIVEGFAKNGFFFNLVQLYQESVELHLVIKHP